MANSTQILTATVPVVRVNPLTQPAWVRGFFNGGSRVSENLLADDLRLELTEASGLTYMKLVLVNAMDLSAAQFQQRVNDTYSQLRQVLECRRTPYPLRFWNFVPGIHRPAHGDMGHYEVFNAGRFEAFSEWYQTPQFGPHMVAASGVGHQGEDFVVHVLAAERPGHGIENPRQHSAYRYSERYGPMPPCFARATVLEAPPGELGHGMLLVSGTASIVGEDSQHLDDLEQQLEETYANLRSLVVEAQGGSYLRDDPLSSFEELRVYMIDEEHEAYLTDSVLAHFPNLRHLELMPADLCRQDLLVEIEGVASLAS